MAPSETQQEPPVAHSSAVNTTAQQPVASSVPSALSLPSAVIGRTDTGRLLREMQELDNFLSQAAIRTPGTPMKLPQMSKLLDQIIANNGLNMFQAEHRTHLVQFLESVYNHAPTIHISFNTDPSPGFMLKLVSWLRAEIDPRILVQVGLQPGMGAGCTIRTTNKYFDFSLRNRFREKRDVLISYLRGGVQK